MSAEGAQDKIQNLSDIVEALEEAQVDRESQEAPETDTTLVVNDMFEGERQSGWQLRDEVETSRQTTPETRDSLRSLYSPHANAESESTQHGCGEEHITDSQSSSPIPLRQSTRQRRPGQMLTYSSLGHPTYQSHPTVCAVDSNFVPSADVWHLQSGLPSWQVPPFVQFPWSPYIYPVFGY